MKKRASYSGQTDGEFVRKTTNWAEKRGKQLNV